MMSLAQPGNLQLQSYRGNNRSSPPQYDEKTFFWLMLYGLPDDLLPNELGGWRPIKDKLRSLFVRPPGRVHIFDDRSPREAMCIINEEVDAYLAYGAFAGCYFNQSLITAALYKKDESSQLGCLQEPVEGPCNRWAKENSSKQQVKVMQNKEQSGGDQNREDGPKPDPPPQYRISLETSDLPRRRQSNPQRSRQVFNAAGYKHSSLQAFLPVMPRFEQIAPNEHLVAYAQGRPMQPWKLANSSRSTIHSPATIAVDPAFLVNHAPYEQHFNLNYGTLPTNPQRFYPYPTLQHSQSEIFDSFQPWPSQTSPTGTLTAGSSSISSSPYVTPPSTGASTSFHPERLQPSAPDHHLLFSTAARRTTREDPDVHRESERSSRTSTPRKDRTLLDGPIIIKSDDTTSM